MIVRASPPEHYFWLAAATGCVITEDFRAIEAVDSSGKVRGMVGYCNWTKNAAQAHMAADSPIVWRSLLGPALEYPFLEAGRGMLLATVSANNSKSLAMLDHLGFERLNVIKDGFALGEDMVFLQLRRENCERLGQKEAA